MLLALRASVGVQMNEIGPHSHDFGAERQTLNQGSSGLAA